MNLIIAIFIYLGLATSSNQVITSQEIDAHQIEINQTVNDPGFIEFMEEHTSADGVFTIDIEADN